MILGLDISTSKIGYSIIDKDNNLVTCHFMKLKTLALEERAEIFYEFLCGLSKKYEIKDIFIEEPFSMFGGGRTTAATMSKLQRFNGMFHLLLEESLVNQQPLYQRTKPESL